MASALVICLLLVLDVIAFGLAIGAERRRSKSWTEQDSEKVHTYCVYDSDISTGLGVGALLFLLLAQILVTVATRCFCCGRPLRPGGSRSCALILFLLSWVTFLVAEICLLAGSARNAYHPKNLGIYGGEDISCATLRKGVFAAGAAFIFFTALLTVIYYVIFPKPSDGSAPLPYKDSGVNMAAYR